MTEIQILNEKINNFIEERDWQQFQSPKDLAISVVLEAAEVLEHFQFKNRNLSTPDLKALSPNHPTYPLKK